MKRSLALPCGLLLILAHGGCLEVPRPPAKGPLEARDIEVSDGLELEQACAPTGPELCFNAVDDNCNGVIDEGCGLRTGLLQFTIAWDDKETDVDLHVNDVEGELARTGEPTGTGLLKDRDCPSPEGDVCFGQNVENVFLTEGDPVKGRYRAVIRLEKLGPAEAPILVRFSARVGQRVYRMNVELSPGPKTEEKTFEFSL